MELKKLLKGVENYKIKGDEGLNIKKIESNSKKIIEDSLFIAIKGFDVDGHDYVEEAIENGAIAVVLDMNANLKKIKISKDITVVIVDDTRKALAQISCNYFGNPSKEFRLVGVTGTKGKTTTTYMIKSILEKAGHKVGLIGTVANYIGDECLGYSSRTTPESIELQLLFYKMAKAECDVVIIEVSSQSLKLNRVAGCDFDYAVFTNLYKDHISPKEHSDMDDYFESKLKLFQMAKNGFVNGDDFKCSKIKRLSPNCNIKTYSIDNSSDLVAKDITITNVCVDYKVKIGPKNERIKVNIPGRYSVYNSLAAISVANALGATVEQIKEGLESTVVPGRNELVPNQKELAVMIDYAHTAESLENILQAAKTYTPGKVICMFGCGGDRDRTKRPMMGEASGRLADYTIITTDNPRSEKPEDIIKEIEEGILKTKGNYEIEVDRKEAIKKALAMAGKRDLVILAGKGHETYQEIKGKKYPFDERVIVKEILGEKKDD